MTRTPRALLLTLVLAFSVSAASAQVQTGTPPFGSFGGGPDVINLGNLNVHFTIPVLHKPGRGLNFTYDLSYDSSVYYPVTSGGTTSWQPVQNWGWRAATEAATGYISDSGTITGTCNPSGHADIPGRITVSNWVYHDPFGISHGFSGSAIINTGNCAAYGGPNSTGFTSTATDGSGYKLVVTGSPTTTILVRNVFAVDGTNETVQENSGTGAASGLDRNGNQITVSGSGVFTDTLGTTALTVAGTAPSPTTFTYTTASGGTAPYTMHYVAKNIKTNFHCIGANAVTEYAANNVNLVNDVTLPDGSVYTFLYEDTPSNPGYVTGRIRKITLPTGGTIEYAYTGGGTGINGIFCADGSAATIARTVTPGGGWTYARSLVSGTHWQTLITDPITTPSANQTVIDFQKNTSSNFYETQRQVYQGLTSGTLLLSANTCYNASASPCNDTAITFPITQRAVITTLPAPGSSNVLTKNVAFYSSSSGMLTETDAYAFGSPAPPTTPTRKTLISYASLGNITGFQQTVSIKDGNDSLIAQTNYSYDETTPSPAPTGTVQLVSVSGSRGNLTSIQNCTAISSGSCSNLLTTARMTYDTAGKMLTAKDAALNQTSFSYADNFFVDNGSNPPQPFSPTNPTDAFVTSITSPSIGAATMGYYVYAGRLAVMTDQNGNNSYNHYLDPFGRATTTFGPIVTGTVRPWTLAEYATAGTQADTYIGITDTTASHSCGSCRHDQVLLDGLGRTVTQTLVSDPEGATSITTNYDQIGRVKNASHPARSTSSTTDGLETPLYDALSRVIKMTHQDSTYVQTFYGAAVSGTGVNTAQLCLSTTYGVGFPTLFIDEAGKKREMWTDGLGRTIEADEPDSSGNLTSYTCYKYDPLDNLLQIVHGSQTRTYAYDALSRVTSVTIPELADASGTPCAVAYTYDSNSNVQTQVSPAPNQTTCTTRVTITFSYDALNRLTAKTYSDSSPAVKYGYDNIALTGCTTTPPSLTITNPKGRRTSMCDSSGAASWSYDSMGRVLTEARTILGVTKNLSYTYNLDGSTATVTYPSTNVITYTISNAQRLTSAKDLAGSVTQFATAASYAPPGGLNGMITGQISGGFGGVTESHTYNNSLEYTSTQATSTAGTALNLTLNYNLAGGDNATVTSVTNNVDSLRTQSFTYDPLNRILSAKSSATSGVDCWGQNFGPDGVVADDGVANLTKINNGSQAPPPCTFGLLNATVDANNHINTDSTYATDAAGNMTKDGSGTGYLYTFDAEGRLTLAAGPSGGPYCYVYDGNGLRVAKKSGATSCASGTVTKLYWRSIAGNALAESDGSGNTLNEYVFFAGRRIASRITSNGNVGIFYYFADQLGSVRTITTGSGKNPDGSNQTPGWLCYDADFTPYGQEISFTARLQTTACPPNYRFTGYEYDSETTNYYAFARYYSPRLGRFLSTDPIGGAIGDLQSHNSYAYVLNDPLNFTDPTGLYGTGHSPWDDGDSHPAPPCPPLFPELCRPSQGPTGGGGPPVVGGGGGGGTTIGPPRTPKPPPAPKCVPPTRLQKAGIKLTGFLARLTGKTIGFGAGGSAGAGSAGLGVAVGASRQVVVSPNGQAAFETSVSSNSVGLPGPTFGGAGVLVGFQVSISNAQNPGELAGPFVQGTASVGDGPGAGVDFAIGAGNVWQGTITGGAGAGGKGGAVLGQLTSITPICGT